MTHCNRYRRLADLDREACAVLEFWFGADADLDDAAYIKARNKVWFQGKGAFDDAIREAFATTTTAALDGAYSDWLQSAHGALALIIVLDQFPRNLYRGDRRAFSGDARALGITAQLVSQQQLAKLHVHEQVFAAMPLQHSEELARQDESVRTFAAIREQAVDDHGPLLDNAYHHAELHRDIVARFGRFPHRNAVLGRDGTEAEAAYLADGAPTFGQ